MEDSTEDLEQVNLYVAIADFEAAESTNISLVAGQCVQVSEYSRGPLHSRYCSSQLCTPSLPPPPQIQVLDSSRSDWWLVESTEDRNIVGWVPANYLEKLLKVHSPSPPPEPFEDETGELQRIFMK